LTANYIWDKKKVRALRKHLGISQSEMAGEMGTRQQTISEWELGLYQPRGMSVTLLNIVADRSSFKYKPENQK
jgi:DNA-binding transcriptional regulator YiaG